ncbi:MAG TPA: alpha/beta hydrolase [Rhodopila sp.]|nr:alpha/beta hydrolase [Rhodopila sp.]
MNIYSPRALGLAAIAAVGIAAAPVAWAQAPAPRDVPAKSIPVPTTVSPQMQKLIAAPLRAGWDVIPQTPQAWQDAVKANAAPVIQNVPGMLQRLHVTVQPTTIAGVKAYVITPDEIPPENRDRLVIQVHGGCYVYLPGEAATPEAILMAGYGHYKVIAVDYRMPPEAYFPAALDDSVAVYKAELKTTKPQNIAIMGTSAGGALTLEMILRAKQLGLPMPGAIAPGTPMSDLTKTGDSFNTNALVDNVLVSPNGFCHGAAEFYAHGHDMKDPLLSPVYGDMHGFPPAILTTGTRDLLLSNTVRVHRKLREAGVDASLQVFEGESHAQYMFDDTAPETKEAFGEIASFFDKHLGR